MDVRLSGIEPGAVLVNEIRGTHESPLRYLKMKMGAKQIQRIKNRKLDTLKLKEARD